MLTWEKEELKSMKRKMERDMEKSEALLKVGNTSGQVKRAAGGSTRVNCSDLGEPSHSKPSIHTPAHPNLTFTVFPLCEVGKLRL